MISEVIVNLREEVHKLLRKIGPGHMMSTAYDTAWIARLSELGEQIGALALEWLRENQLPDGAWGAPQPVYAHDRVISTLAAMNALARRGRAADRERLRRAEDALEYYIAQLHTDMAGETIGFEMIVPTLLHEAKSLGAIHRDEMHVINKLMPRRASKLAVLPKKMISRFVTVAFSAEMAGPDGMALLDVDHLREKDGSVSYSPSATAYYALYIRRNDKNTLEYLRRIAPTGAAPNVSTFDIFEQAWTLWNLALIANLDSDSVQLCRPHLDFMQKAWVPGEGAGFAADYAPKDGDETSLVYEVLTHYGRKVDLEAVLSYEEPDNFRCFALESSPSVSANVHILSALRCAGFEANHPSVRKIMRFLEVAKNERPFLLDKWHASPYYVTSHAIIACAGYNDALVQNAVQWIVDTQRQDGSWGYFIPTAEETAYCLQALAIWNRNGGQAPRQILKTGATWLKDHIEPPYPPLWIGKCLYCPEMVNKSAILSALILVDQE